MNFKEEMKALMIICGGIFLITFLSVGCYKYTKKIQSDTDINKMITYSIN